MGMKAFLRVRPWIQISTQLSCWEIALSIIIDYHLEFGVLSMLIKGHPWDSPLNLKIVNCIAIIWTFLFEEGLWNYFLFRFFFFYLFSMKWAELYFFSNILFWGITFQDTLFLCCLVCYFCNLTLSYIVYIVWLYQPLKLWPRFNS